MSADAITAIAAIGGGITGILGIWLYWRASEPARVVVSGAALVVGFGLQLWRGCGLPWSLFLILFAFLAAVDRLASKRR